MEKILVVTNSMSGGGAERSMNSLVNLLHQNSVDVTIFPINHGPMDAVMPVCKVISPVRAWKAGIFSTLIAFVKFRSQISKAYPSLVVANCELPELFSVLLPLRMKLIFVEHTSRPWRKQRFLGSLVRKLASLRKTQWVLVSDHLKEQGRDRNMSLVIPNLISAVSNKLAEGHSVQSRIVFIGRLSEEKDPELFLNIAQLCGMPGLIIGAGVMSEFLSSQSAASSIQIEVLGQLDNPWAKIHTNDIMVLTSQYEGDGLVLLEAVSRGLPVLVRDTVDFRRFGLPEKNYFASAGDASEKLLGQDPTSLIIPSQVVHRILSSRSETSILSSWLELINRITGP